MSIHIGNAPCSWGVEFAGDPRNPDWRAVLRDCAQAGYRGIELGPHDRNVQKSDFELLQGYQVLDR